MIPTPTITEILIEDFNVDLDSLPVKVDMNTVIDLDTSKKLAEYLGVSDTFFYDLQQDINTRNRNFELLTA